MKALITGASSGIGESMAYYMKDLGYDLILTASDENRLAKVAKNIGGKVETIACDLRYEEEVYKLYDKVKD